MSLYCQFCDKNPGYLITFAKAWVCLGCVDRFALEDHPALGNSSYTDRSGCMFPTEADCAHWSDYYEDGYYIKLQKAEVNIEELECNAVDLSSHALKVLAVASTSSGKGKEMDSGNLLLTAGEWAFIFNSLNISRNIFANNPVLQDTMTDEQRQQFINDLSAIMRKIGLNGSLASQLGVSPNVARPIQGQRMDNLQPTT